MVHFCGTRRYEDFDDLKFLIKLFENLQKRRGHLELTNSVFEYNVFIVI